MRAALIACLFAIAPAQAWVLEGEMYESLSSSDLVAIARPVSLQRMRVGDACVYELVTCELLRVLHAPGGVDLADRSGPRPRICVFRQLESDDANFPRQVLVEGRAYLFVLARTEQDGCYSPRSRYYPLLEADATVLARAQLALFGREGEPLEPTALAEPEAIAQLRGAVANARARVEALAKKSDQELLGILDADGVGDALWGGFASDRRVCLIEAEPAQAWKLAHEGDEYEGSFLVPHDPLRTGQVTPSLEGEEPLLREEGRAFHRMHLVLDGLQATETTSAVERIETARGPVTLRVHLKSGAGALGAVNARPDERERHEGIPAREWVGRARASAQALALREVLAAGEAAAVVREPALEALADLGAPAVPAALELLASPDAEHAALALRALGRMGPAAEPALVAIAARARDARAPLEVRALALETLGDVGVGAPRAIEALAAGLKENAPELRLRAAEALGEIGPVASATVPALAALLRDVEPRVQSTAAHALGAMGEGARSATAELVAALGSPHEPLVREATLALPAVGAPASEVVPALVKQLEGGEARSELWWPACQALATYGREAAAALPVLKKAEETGPGPLRAIAADARKRIEKALEGE